MKKLTTKSNRNLEKLSPHPKSVPNPEDYVDVVPFKTQEPFTPQHMLPLGMGVGVGAALGIFVYGIKRRKQ